MIGYIFLAIFIVILFYFWIKFLSRRQLKKLMGGYNAEEDKSRKSGFLKGRREESNGTTSNRQYDERELSLEGDSESKGRELLPIPTFERDTEVKSSDGSTDKSPKRFFGFKFKRK